MCAKLRCSGPRLSPYILLSRPINVCTWNLHAGPAWVMWIGRHAGGHVPLMVYPVRANAASAPLDPAVCACNGRWRVDWVSRGEVVHACGRSAGPSDGPDLPHGRWPHACQATDQHPMSPVSPGTPGSLGMRRPATMPVLPLPLPESEVAPVGSTGSGRASRAWEAWVQGLARGKHACKDSHVGSMSARYTGAHPFPLPTPPSRLSSCRSAPGDLGRPPSRRPSAGASSRPVSRRSLPRSLAASRGWAVFPAPPETGVAQDACEAGAHKIERQPCETAHKLLVYPQAHPSSLPRTPTWVGAQEGLREVGWQREWRRQHAGKEGGRSLHGRRGRHQTGGR